MSTHNPVISSREIARLIDISAVRADSTRQDVEDIIDVAIKHNFICVFPMPGMLPLVFEKLKDHPQIGIGGVVGFPSGGETTASKLFQAKELKEAGCNEIDMVLNIGKLKSGMLNDIEDEIRQIKATVSREMQALGTDYIDFGFLHCVDEDEDFDKLTAVGVWD